MAQYNIKKEKGKVSVEVSIVPLPRLAKDADLVAEIVRRDTVVVWLTSQHQIVTYDCLEDAGTLSNFGTNPTLRGTFVFSTTKKDLTTEEKSVIVEWQPKKRKRVKRDSKTGTNTIS